MKSRWWSGPPPHERGLSRGEQEIRDAADPNYRYCVIRKHYDFWKQQVWLTAEEGQSVIGRSRVLTHRRTFLGDLRRFDRDLEAASGALVETLLDNGWEPVGGDPQQPALVFRRPRERPDTKP